MIQRKTGKCKNPECNYSGFLYSKGLCQSCYWKSRQEKKKPTGELQLFKEIWNTRIHKSFISGRPLYGPKHYLWINQFAHCVAKGKCPQLRLDTDNIVLLHPEEHYLYDFGSSSQRDAYKKKHPETNWDALYNLKEGLKTKVDFK